MRTRTTRALLLPLAGATTLVGCWGPASYRTHHGSYTRVDLGWGYQPAQPTAQPRLALEEAEVEQAFAALAARRETKARLAQASAPLPAGDVWSAREAIEEAWRQARREQAEALVSGSREVLELDEALASGAVTVLCHYESWGRGGALELTMERGSARGDVAVAIHPGTYGEPIGVADVIDAGGERPWVDPRQDRRYRHWPSPQDLALLRAQVVVLPAGQHAVRASFPVSCASFEKQGPQPGQAYELKRFPVDSAADRLLVALCADEVKGSESEVQLAVWLARNDISWDQFTREGGHWGRLVTFGHGGAVLPEHADGAARMLLDSGVDPRASRFFGGDGIGAGSLAPLAPGGEAEPEPAEPEPAEPQVEQTAEEALEG